MNVTAQNIPPPTVAISGNSQSGFNLTLAGYEPLSLTASSSDQTVISNSGITFSGGCGTSTLNCNVALSPVAQANGSTTITITASDPFGQTGNASTSETYTYTPPKSGGGGSMSWFVLISLSGLILLRYCIRLQRSKGNATLLSIAMLCLLAFGSAQAGTLDARLAALVNEATPAPPAASVNQSRNPFAPRFDSAGRVQVYILPSSPTAALPGSTELAALGAVKIEPSEALHLIQAWVPIASLRAIAALPDVGRVTVPAYAVPQRATVNPKEEGSPTKPAGGGSMAAVVLLLMSAILMASRLFMTGQTKFLGKRRSSVRRE